MDLRSLEFAHDLKMPIQLIYSCVQLLEMELKPDARASSYLNMLMRSANQLQTMVSNALEANAPQGGEKLRVAAEDVVARARDVSRQCALFAREKNIEVRFDANVSEFRMAVDGEKLERILHNLLSNALRFTPEGGCVRVAVQVCGDAVDFVVADNGCGIAPQRQARVFDLGETEGGYGYGLAIVRQYAQMMGGHVRLESACGCGCRFTVHLPVRAADCQAS